MPPLPDEFLTQNQAAALANVTVRYLQLRRTAGSGPPVIRIGTRGIRYEKSAFITWLTTSGATPAITKAAAGAGERT